MDKLHATIAVLGGFFFVWFAMPAIRILNIGNITGMLFSAILCGYGIFYARVHAWIFALWQRSSGKAVVIIVVAATGILFFIVIVETIGMVCAAQKYPPQNTTAIVLGCSVKGEQPSWILKERLDVAYKYLTENPKAYCVLSGGQGEDEEISEAECMYRYLTEKGIDPTRLFCEDASTNTEENLLFSKKLLEQNGISGEVTIVTSEFHAYRAYKMAEELGMDSYSTPSRTFWLYLPTYYVRELYGILYYKIK